MTLKVLEIAGLTLASTFAVANVCAQANWMLTQKAGFKDIRRIVDDLENAWKTLFRKHRSETFQTANSMLRDYQIATSERAMMQKNKTQLAGVLESMRQIIVDLRIPFQVGVEQPREEVQFEQSEDDLEASIEQEHDEQLQFEQFSGQQVHPHGHTHAHFAQEHPQGQFAQHGQFSQRFRQQFRQQYAEYEDDEDETDSIESDDSEPANDPPRDDETHVPDAQTDA